MTIPSRDSSLWPTKPSWGLALLFIALVVGAIALLYLLNEQAAFSSGRGP